MYPRSRGPSYPPGEQKIRGRTQHLSENQHSLLSISPEVLLSHTLTHTHTYTHIHSHTHTHTHTYTKYLNQPTAFLHTHRSYSKLHVHINIYTEFYTSTTLNYTQTPTHTNTHTYKRTQDLVKSCRVCSNIKLKFV